MTLHQNAKTCPASRRLLCRRVEQQGWSLRAAAEAAGLSERRAGEWLATLARRRSGAGGSFFDGALDPGSHVARG